MVTPASPPPSARWPVLSVSVRVRDGPRRLEAAYRRLLEPVPSPPTLADGSDAAGLATEVDHASRHLRPGLDRSS